jgi:hypothetical protein
LFAANTQNELFAVDTNQYTFTKTDAVGQILALAPVDGRSLYTVIQKPIQDVLMIEDGPGNVTRVSLAQAHIRAVLLEYAIEDGHLKPASATDNAADNGRALAISADGSRIAVAGGGGWRPRNDERRSYVITVFDAENLQTMLGQLETGPYPAGVAFHPDLSLGAAFRAGHNPEVIVFEAESLVRRAAFPVARAGVTGFLIFADRGTKLVYASQSVIPGRTEPSVLQFFSLELTRDEQRALREARGESE